MVSAVSAWRSSLHLQHHHYYLPRHFMRGIMTISIPSYVSGLSGMSSQVISALAFLGTRQIPRWLSPQVSKDSSESVWSSRVVFVSEFLRCCRGALLELFGRGVSASHFASWFLEWERPLRGSSHPQPFRKWFPLLLSHSHSSSVKSKVLLLDWYFGSGAF